MPEGIIPPMDEGFMRRLEQRMTSQGFTMKSLSLAAGLGETAVRDILRRGYSPSIDTARSLAIKLKTTTGWLVDGEGPPESSGQEDEAPHDAASAKQIGIRLSALRAAMGLDEEQFGKLAGAERWSDYELGYARVTFRQAIRICQRTGVTLDWIYFGNLSAVPLRLAGRLSELLSGAG